MKLFDRILAGVFACISWLAWWHSKWNISLAAELQLHAICTQYIYCDLSIFRNIWVSGSDVRFRSIDCFEAQNNCKLKSCNKIFHLKWDRTELNYLPSPVFLKKQYSNLAIKRFFSLRELMQNLIWRFRSFQSCCLDWPKRKY